MGACPRSPHPPYNKSGKILKSFVKDVSVLYTARYQPGPGVAGAVLQTPLSLIQSMILFLQNINISLPLYHKSPPPFVTCYVLCVTCWVSHVITFLDKGVELVNGGYVINRAYIA